jgi:GNAT superfamily N-acetyltransferase
VGIVVRAVEVERLGEWVALRNGLVPAWPLALEDVLHAKREGARRVELEALLDGEVAGGGVAARRSMSGGSEVFANAWVVPERRRLGVGRAILAAASEYARGWGGTELEGYVDEDEEAGLAFARSLGFAEIGRDVQVVLELAGAELPEPRRPDGIEVVTLAERPDLEEALYRAELEAVPDIPTPDPQQVGSLEDWRYRELEAPGIRRDAIFLALEGDELVGYASLSFTAASPESACHEMTGVRRAWRGRGIARLLKETQIAWAKANGLERLETDNHEDNAPIRALNERLGYRRTTARLTLRGPLL